MAHHKHASSLDTATQCPRKHAWPRAAAALRLSKEAVENRPRRHDWAGTAGVVSIAHGHGSLRVCGAVLLSSAALRCCAGMS